MNFPLLTLLLLPSLEVYMQPSCGHTAEKHVVVSAVLYETEKPLTAYVG